MGGVQGGKVEVGCLGLGRGVGGLGFRVFAPSARIRACVGAS